MKEFTQTINQDPVEPNRAEPSFGHPYLLERLRPILECTISTLTCLAPHAKTAKGLRKVLIICALVSIEIYQQCMKHKKFSLLNRERQVMSVLLSPCPTSAQSKKFDLSKGLIWSLFSTRVTVNMCARKQLAPTVDKGGQTPNTGFGSRAPTNGGLEAEPPKFFSIKKRFGPF